MATYYVDPAASGSNNGTSWTDAWTSLQSAADTATAGDTVYCRGTQNISAAIDFDTNSGTYNGGYIKFIGCNASGNVDGTRFTLVRAANDTNGIYINGKSFIWLENINIENFTGEAGIRCASSNADHWKLINVRCYGMLNGGMYCNNYGRYWQLIRCSIVSNGAEGIYRPAYCMFDSCQFINNGSHGITHSIMNMYSNCIFHNNGSYGIDCTGGGNIINCVFDANASGGVRVNNTTMPAILIGCRITNHNGVGKLGVYVLANTRVGLECCYFGNNTTDVTADRYDIIPINGATDHVIFGGSDTNHGYVDQMADDFNLRSDASIRAYAVPLP